MYTFLKKLLSVVISRPARNSYLWLLFIINFYSTGTAAAFPYSQNAFIGLITISLCVYASMIYINNLWLLPRYIRKKQYGAYVIRLVFLLLIYGCLLTYYNYCFDRYFPLSHFNDVALISLDYRHLYTAINADFFAALDTTLSAIFPLALFILVLSMGWFMNDYFIQQKRLDEAVKEKLESELALIKHQISPHFLFNTLNNLYGLSLVKSDNLPKSILQLSDILRYLIYESSGSLVSFEKEKQVIESYIHIELLRVSDTQHLVFNVSADRNYQIPPLLWLPVLENIFKHAIRQIRDDISVNFNFSITNNQLHISSRNPLPPTEGSSSKKELYGGFGLENLKKRLDIIYPARYVIEERVDKNMYEIDIKVTLYETDVFSKIIPEP